MKTLVQFLKESMITEAELYKGGKELCEFISKIIKENPDKNFIVINAKDIKDVEPIFFKHLLIYINNEVPIKEGFVGASYNINHTYKQTKKALGDMLKWNIDEKIFNYVEIYIATLSEDDRDVDWEDIAHEVNHAWDDYQKRLTDPNSYLNCDIDQEEYKQLKVYVTKGNLCESLIAYLKYANIDSEKKSYSVQATEKFKSNLDKYDNYDDALDWQFKNNPVFMSFLLYKNKFDTQIKKRKSLTEMLGRAYRRIYKEDVSDNDVLEKVENMFTEHFSAISEDINRILDAYGKKTSL